MGVSPPPVSFFFFQAALAFAYVDRRPCEQSRQRIRGTPKVLKLRIISNQHRARLTSADIEDYGATSPAMSTPGSREIAAGLAVMLVSVSAAMHVGAGGFGLLLCLTGVLVGASLIAAGVRMADGPAPIVPVAIGGAGALAAFVRRNVASVGLVMASCAFTVVSGEEDLVLCFGMFALLLLGVILINIGARGE